MKDQYTGDINDYRKYAVLRALAGAHGGRLRVCWMLTPGDSRRDGERLAYLSAPSRFRDLDPTLFDALAELVAAGRRSVRAVEAARVLPGAIFHSTILPDVGTGRERYFAAMWSRLGPDELAFFDPDNGLEVPSVRKGRRDSSKYLYWDELVRTLGEGRSVCVYQHFPRRPRAAFVGSLLDRLRMMAPDHRAFAIYSPSVAYLVCTPSDRLDALRRAAAEVAARPRSQFELAPRL